MSDKGVVKDDWGRGWKIKYALYINGDLNEKEAEKHATALVKALSKDEEVTDWDGPL